MRIKHWILGQYIFNDFQTKASYDPDILSDHVLTVFQFQKNTPLIALKHHFDRPVVGIASGELRHLIKPDRTGYTADQEMMGILPFFDGNKFSSPQGT